ncbi:MAG: AAA family ATPase [Lachnospiraceae bacterium]|nr:AAA family ATPase [Lachnospiraceae bacterium]
MRNIILLNGPSSAGKSTLSRELQKRFEEKGAASVIISIDDHMVTDPKETIYEDDIYEIMPGMCRDIRSMVNAGKIVIVDHAITSERIYDMFLDAAKCGVVLSVKVTCDPEILRRREKERGDRCPGSAEASLRYLWPKDGYDLCIDNGKVSVADNAEKILAEVYV